MKSIIYLIHLLCSTVQLLLQDIVSNEASEISLQKQS
jgi:hypothetical protein